jgi:hypothetical protein
VVADRRVGRRTQDVFLLHVMDGERDRERVKSRFEAGSIVRLSG